MGVEIFLRKLKHFDIMECGRRHVLLSRYFIKNSEFYCKTRTLFRPKPFPVNRKSIFIRENHLKWMNWWVFNWKRCVVGGWWSCADGRGGGLWLYFIEAIFYNNLEVKILYSYGMIKDGNCESSAVRIRIFYKMVGLNLT